jgi:aspartokinase-like uncharacterized kinase
VTSRPVLLVAGGGSLVDVLRDWDRQHQLGEETAHWLALRCLSVSAHFLASLLPGVKVVTDLASLLPNMSTLAVVDGHAFAQADQGRSGSLPHSWRVTSDSLAARIAHVAGARRLVLLKSTDIPDDLDWSEAGRRELVDPHFAKTAAGLTVQAINFRHWKP